jgi:cytochrome c-type biogenesis protein CcmH/NrfF
VNATVVWVVPAVAVLVGLGLWALRGRGNEARRLRERYLRTVHQPRAQAEQSLARHLARLRERFPGQSEVWYLRHVLAELRRDRR